MSESDHWGPGHRRERGRARRPGISGRGIMATDDIARAEERAAGTAPGRVRDDVPEPTGKTRPAAA